VFSTVRIHPVSVGVEDHTTRLLFCWMLELLLTIDGSTSGNVCIGIRSTKRDIWRGLAMANRVKQDGVLWLYRFAEWSMNVDTRSFGWVGETDMEFGLDSERICIQSPYFPIRLANAKMPQKRVASPYSTLVPCPRLQVPASVIMKPRDMIEARVCARRAELWLPKRVIAVWYDV
jgi:hypothetical protein